MRQTRLRRDTPRPCRKSSREALANAPSPRNGHDSLTASATAKHEGRNAMAKPEASDRKPDTGRSDAGLWKAAGCVVLLLAAPGATIAFIASLLAYERRRVRAQWWAGWAAATLAIGICLAGFSVTGWLYWSGSSIALLLPVQPPDTAAAGYFGWIRAHSDISILEMVWMQAWFGIPLGFATTTVVIVGFRSHSRALRGQIEGPEHSNMRPVGILDRRRRNIERRKVAAGHYTTPMENR